MKHQRRLISGGNLFGVLIFERGMSNRDAGDLLGMNMEMDADLGDWQPADSELGWYVVSWPEHVTRASYNGDAFIAYAGESLTALVEQRIYSDCFVEGSPYDTLQEMIEDNAVDVYDKSL